MSFGSGASGSWRRRRCAPSRTLRQRGPKDDKALQPSVPQPRPATDPRACGDCPAAPEKPADHRIPRASGLSRAIAAYVAMTSEAKPTSPSNRKGEGHDDDGADCRRCCCSGPNMALIKAKRRPLTNKVVWACEHACRTVAFAYLVRTSPRLGSRRHDIVVSTTPSRRLRVTFPSKMKGKRCVLESIVPDTVRMVVDALKRAQKWPQASSLSLEARA